MSEPQIVAAGGLPDLGKSKLERAVLDLCGKERPRVCYVPTANGDDANGIVRFYETYGRLGASVDALRLFRRTPADLRAYLFDFDVIHVGGGNTRSMLAVWRHWDLDVIIGEAWRRGIVLCGSSAGSLCWFESGVTDSLAGDLSTMACLGMLPGSHCPHYDGEAERRPFYERAIATGALQGGLACDDGAAVHFAGTRLVRAIASLPNANVYRVERDGDVARSHVLEIQRL